MTRLISTLGIVLLFGALAWAQQSGPPGTTQQQDSKPPVQPGQTAPPAQPGARLQAPPVQTPQPRPGQAQSAPPPPGPPQSSKQASEARQAIKIRTNLVIIPVTVKNRDGQLIGDLQRDEFRVFCDNVEQQIVFFTSDPFPLSAVVLIDNDLSIKSADQVQKSLTAISAGFGPLDEVALVTYDQFPNTVAYFSFNNDQLFTKLKRLDLAYRYPGPPLGGPLTQGATVNGKSAETGLPTQNGVRQEPERSEER